MKETKGDTGFMLFFSFSIGILIKPDNANVDLDNN